MSENAVAMAPAEIAAKFVNLTDRHIYLTGKAGTGKTTFLHNIISLTHKKAVIVAPTGIAAINAGGVTIHSLFQLPFGTYLPKDPPEHPGGAHINTPRSLLRHLNMNAVKRRILTDLELLIVDEVSMLRADLLDAMDMVLRHIRKRHLEPFGGVQVLFIGDLHQLPPVVKPQEWQVMSSFYKSIYFFDALALQQDMPVYIELDKIYRQSDQTFISLLNNLRNNEVTDSDIALLQQYYKENFKPAISDQYITLTTHNSKADTLNSEMLAALDGRTFFYNAIIGGDFPETAYPQDKKLELKIGAQVMFTKNDPTGAQRFFNGKIGSVTALDSELILVRTDGGDIVVEPYTWKNIVYNTDRVTNEVKEEVLGTFEQYPLKLAWAITVHKSQGLTFDRAIVDIGDAFAPGQVYVALSRLRSLDGLVLTSKLTNRGIRPDQHISYFNRNRLPAAMLADRIKDDQAAFLQKNLLHSFNFAQLDRETFEHSFSYNKDEKRSAKQKHQQWAADLQQEIKALKADADKFLNQLNRLFAIQDATKISERVMAAAAYFNAVLRAASLKVFGQIEVIKKEKYSNAYFNELIGLELLLYEQYKKILKAAAFLQAAEGGRELQKEDINKLLVSEEREAMIKKAYAGTVAAEEKRTPAKKGKKGIREPKQPKEPREDTKEVTLRLFESGKSIEEIAQTREMAIGTIEAHLAFFVAGRAIEPTRLLSPQKLKAIAEAAQATKSASLTTLKKKLGADYSFGEIKIGLAAHFTEDQ